jgi:hypothetical protein
MSDVKARDPIIERFPRLCPSKTPHARARQEVAAVRRKPSFANVLKIARALGTTCEAFADCEDLQDEEEAKPKGRKQPPPDKPARRGKKRQ